MSVSTVEVMFTKDRRWVVACEGSEDHVPCASRGVAIAAAMKIAIENDAVLLIHGIDDKPDELFFKECEASVVE
ncbi:DUF2188 domain-containing protein [Cupriavidus oxalaticus]|uniref:DUF2188 domain-containing protein n=1 Tax=Cupriavidus oxalaticus TaxID=96344 RepID=A0A976BFU0_9BURK|nr:DUF2188 domain-containing protein [Cupriavidus oxalaticus]QRQ86237.1 DUF2188 domain-containing protein [Cupriavidus oxalaticus]QRQ95436.1 DUF2188 domain-containing protein [Cupriavidus oxalaticus]WQD84095.1 DUF2188 domain-containing protein [Cupriavidus oxalaticus]SPC17411.1 conserved hypothetical protein [Cupriavidus oxalaticus]